MEIYSFIYLFEGTVLSFDKIADKLITDYGRDRIESSDGM